MIQFYQDMQATRTQIREIQQALEQEQNRKLDYKNIAQELQAAGFNRDCSAHYIYCVQDVPPEVLRYREIRGEIVEYNASLYKTHHNRIQQLTIVLAQLNETLQAQSVIFESGLLALKPEQRTQAKQLMVEIDTAERQLEEDIAEDISTGQAFRSYPEYNRSAIFQEFECTMQSRNKTHQHDMRNKINQLKDMLCQLIELNEQPNVALNF